MPQKYLKQNRTLFALCTSDVARYFSGVFYTADKNKNEESLHPFLGKEAVEMQRNENFAGCSDTDWLRPCCTQTLY